MRLRSPAAFFLRRAQLIFMVTAAIPTVLMTLVGVLLVATGGSKSVALVSGILVLAFCATSLSGYVLGTIFVTRGAGLASFQNEFLSSVSHELRTPLTSIRLFIETLQEGRITDPAERQRCLTVVHHEITRLDTLVGKLIALSKIESSRATFDQRPVALAEVIDEALVAFKAISVGSGVDLHVTVDPELKVYGDRAALGQAVANLLANSWKYTDAETRRIDVTTSADSRHVFIVVADNGIGIPVGEQQVIFEKFERGAAALDRGSSGSGLGLAIVQAIVKAHRGKIDVHSVPHRGARFRITLPRWESEAA
ncbi:MAG TPA: HAMP domain-containing sensor histidine kinase [Polyangia bacterium]|nr:HAMP domain-containing sensor histidine kinase [Polyangia bacterium]